MHAERVKYTTVCFPWNHRTVQSIGVLSGKQLLGLSRENLRLACPEEGGKMFFQLQPIKSAIAVSIALRLRCVKTNAIFPQRNLTFIVIIPNSLMNNVQFIPYSLPPSQGMDPRK